MTLRAALVLLATLAFAAGPFLFPEFGGFDPGAYPIPQDNPPVQPAGYAFAIWGPIYLWLLVSAGYGVVRRREDRAWDVTRLPLIVSLAVGAVWLPVANASPVWASVLIWIMLLAALAAVCRAPRSDRALLAWPLGLYAGWLTAASVVSLGLLAAGYGLLEESQAGWAGALAAAVFAGLVAVRLANPFYALAAGWALFAVAVSNWEAHLALAVASALAAAGLLGIALLSVRDTDSLATPPAPPH